MAVYNDMTPADIAAVTGNNNRNNGMWGGDWAAWIVLFLIFGIFGWGGMGFGGFGGFGGGIRGANSPGFQGYATRADINEGFVPLMVLTTAFALSRMAFATALMPLTPAC